MTKDVAPDLAALRAAAAQESAAAEEEAQVAEAAQAQAAEAAEAAAADPADHTEDGTPAPTSGELSEHAAEVAAGYTFDGPSLRLGALIEDDVAQPGAQVALPLAMMNRHGLVAGATGTGKTRTLQVMAEELSAAGVPVFLADIKGDLSGLIVAGEGTDGLLRRTESIGQDWTPTTFPVEFYTLGGMGIGVPIRTTVTDFGPLLLARVLGLNATQESCLGLIFHWANTQGLALLDLKDLQATIAYLTSEDGKEELRGIGGVSSATAGVILREIVALQAQGADVFFGEPAFATEDLLRLAPDGRGVISALQLPAVQDRPALFTTFLMWLLADLFSGLPEVGDQAKPKLVFFFDEAHLLFNGASKAFLEQVTQTVRLIRSKGVGIFFVTQTPQDVPRDVLGQLGNRVQHALRAFTPEDAKALRAAVRTYPRSAYDLEALLTSLGTGEAVVTVLTEKGAPTPVAWTRLRAPVASMEPAPEGAMQALVQASPSSAAYGTPVDNESAYELLGARIEAQAAAAAAVQADAEAAKAEAKAATEAEKKAARREAELRKMEEKLRRDAEKEQATRAKTQRTAVDSFLRSAGTVLGREITRTIFGTRRR